MKTWFAILSEFLVNIAAGWFGVALFEPKTGTLNDILLLILKLILAILSLFTAKLFRDKEKRRIK